MRWALITGAGGFIGGVAVREFLSHGWGVAACVHRRMPAWLEALDGRPGSRVVRADLGDASRVEALGRELEKADILPDCVVHCAGRASDVGWRSEFRRANFDAVRHVVDLARRLTIRRLVFLSTTDVYGLREFAGQDEDELPLGAYPPNPYPEYKIAAENLIRGQLPPDRYVILRPAQVWGVGDTTLTKRIVDFLAWSPRIVHFGSWRGRNRWPLAHVRNVAMACRAAADDGPAGGTAINVLDDERTSMDEWYRLLAGIYLPGKPLRTVTLPMAAGRAVGALVSAVSSALNLPHPFMDPSDYALFAVSRNLDFGNRRFLALMQRAGLAPVTRQQGLEELRKEEQTAHPGDRRP